MSSRVVLYTMIACGGIIAGAGHYEEEVKKLQTRNIEVSSSNDGVIEGKEFYPLLAIGDQREGQEERFELDKAFYTPPEPEPEPVEVVEVEVEPEPEPEPVDIDPINFLEVNKHLFTLQAIFFEQKSVILNGQSYKEGETMLGKLPANWVDKHGEAQRELLDIKVSDVTQSAVVLTSTHSDKEWTQRVRLPLY